MPRPRKVEDKTRKTRTIRVYEETALLIDAITRKEGSTLRTQGDVVEDWAKRLYPNAVGAVTSLTSEIGSAIDEDQERLGKS